MRQLCAATAAAVRGLLRINGYLAGGGCPGGAEEDGATKKAAGKGRSGGRRGAYFYAQEMLICQLLEYEELGWGAIGECFFSFSKKNKDGEERFGTLGDALMTSSQL